jgi:hypothetical protein
MTLTTVWNRAVEVMAGLGVAAALCECLIIFVPLLAACVAHRTCRPSRIVRSALRGSETDEQPNVAARHGVLRRATLLLRRLAAEESRARGQGRRQRADFLAGLRTRLALQKRDAASALTASEQAYDQLVVDVARATWGISRGTDPPPRGLLPSAPAPASARVGPDSQPINSSEHQEQRPRAYDANAQADTVLPVHPCCVLLCVAVAAGWALVALVASTSSTDSSWSPRSDSDGFLDTRQRAAASRDP